MEVALEQKAKFEKAKAFKVDYLIFDRKNADSEKNLKIVNEATGIFFTGGDQSKLVSSLRGTRFFDRIQNLYYERGGVLSGTSAGAAVMSEIMLTGDELLHKNPDFISIQKNNVKTAEGFGFINNAIIDQHFIKRKRQNRLISLSLENPKLPCIGIDESTSIIVKPDDTFTVFGENMVMIFDSENAKNISVDKNGNLSGNNIIMHLLQSGNSYNLRTKKVKY